MMATMLPGFDDVPPPRTAALTPGERHALGVVERYIAEHGESPTVRQLAAALGVWPSRAGRVLDAFAAAGVIRRAPGRARGFVMVIG